MDYEQYENARKYLLLHPNNKRYSIEYFGEWHGYEENGWLIILNLKEDYYFLSGGYSVMNDDYTYNELSPEQNPLQKISLDEALVMIDDMELHIKNILK